nr:hypothetical protein [Tanacetum cinerariifolium]
MFELVKICQEKELLCIHDDVNDLIESALDSKLLLINLNSQHLDKNEQEIKNVVEQPAEHGNRRYEHLSITPETEYDEVKESNAENLLPIPSKCEDNDNLDSSDDESLPDEDVPAEEFKIYSNPLCDEDEINSDKLDPHCFNVESDFVESLLNREELNAEIVDTIIESIPLLPIPIQDGNSQQGEIDIVTETDDVLPPSVENNDDDLSNYSLLEEADLFLVYDNLIPLGIENVADDPEGDILFLEELFIDNSILSHESFDSSFEDNPSIPRPPPEPPDAETDKPLL